MFKSILTYFGASNDESGANKHLDILAPEKGVILSDDSLVDLITIFDKVSSHGIEVGISFKPNLTQFTPSTLTLMVKNTLNDFINSIRRLRINPDLIDLIFIGECSPVGRYHMHGTISGLNYYEINKLKRVLNQELGRPDIKQIRYVISYTAYAFKQYQDQQYTTNNYTDILSGDKPIIPIGEFHKELILQYRI